MKYSDHDPLLSRLSKFLVQQTGLHFPQERWSDLARGIDAAAREFGLGDTASCIRHLLSAPLTRYQIETLARHLTVGETYFFREPQIFDVLQTDILPALIQSRRASGQHLRLWSAGCATGEEAYSLAILVQRLIPDFRQWNITILGTDINPHALRKATSGTYGDWSFRNAPPWLREGYFHATGGGQYAIIRSVREMVTFSYLNLAEDAYPSLANNTNAMDIIFCRNVLMYFEPGLATSVVRKHHQALVDGGWLIVSPSEISQALFADFVTTNFPGAILHQKPAAGTTPAKITQWPPAPIAAPPAIGLPPTGIRTPVSTGPSRAATVNANQHKEPQPTYQRAHALYRQGRYAEAAAETSRLLAICPGDVSAMTLMARIHANQGELSAALHWCEQTIAADRLNPVGHYLRAAILQEHGRMEEAMLSYKRTLYLDQDFVLAHFALGNLFRRQNRSREARKHFENTLLLLDRHDQDDVLPESDGMTAGRLTEIIRSGAYTQEQVA